MTNPTIIFPEPRKVVIEDRPVPQAARGQVLIRTAVSLISTGTELAILGGAHASDPSFTEASYPFLPGYNNIGVVEAVGEGVGPSWIGRRVATYGTHAAYVTMPIGRCHPVDTQIPDDQAVFFTIAEIVLNGLRRSKLALGESAAVFGLGLLGQMTVRVARLTGARPVLAIDIAPSRLVRLPRDPAIIAVQAGEVDLDDIIDRATRRRRIDVVFELTGVPALISPQFAALRNQGRFVLLSSPRGRTEFDFNNLCNVPSITIIGAHNQSHPKSETPDHPWTRARHVELFFDLLGSRELDMTPLISHREPFTAAPRLYEMLLADRSQALGVILKWT